MAQQMYLPSVTETILFINTHYQLLTILSTASYASKAVLAIVLALDAVLLIKSYPYGITASADGTKMYVLGEALMTLYYQYTAYQQALDVSTASYAFS